MNATVLIGALSDWSKRNLTAVLLKLRRSLFASLLCFCGDFKSDDDSFTGFLDGHLRSKNSCHL